MNDRQLKSFIRAAELNSFAKAAKEAYITPPALINQINTLEKDMGKELFIRTKHGIALTPEGEIMFRVAKQIVEIYNDGLKECELIPKTESVLNIAMDIRLFHKFNVFSYEFNELNPNISLNFQDFNWSKLKDPLINNVVQLVYCAEPIDLNQDEMAFVPDQEAVFTVLVTPDHPLAKKDLITVEDLRAYKLLSGNRPLRKLNPISVFEEKGLDIHAVDEPCEEFRLYNSLRNQMCLILTDAIRYTTSFENVIIPTDISAGCYGFVMEKNPNPIVDVFLKEFFNKKQ